MKVGMGEGPSGSYAVNGRRVQTDTQEVHEAGGERLADVLVDRGVQNQLLDFSYMQAHADRRGRGGTDRVGSGFAMEVVIGVHPEQQHAVLYACTGSIDSVPCRASHWSRALVWLNKENPRHNSSSMMPTDHMSIL